PQHIGTKVPIYVRSAVSVQACAGAGCCLRQSTARPAPAAAPPNCHNAGGAVSGGGASTTGFAGTALPGCQAGGTGGGILAEGGSAGAGPLGNGGSGYSVA